LLRPATEIEFTEKTSASELKVKRMFALLQSLQTGEILRKCASNRMFLIRKQLD